MIRKAGLALLLLMAVANANGQGYRSMSVWHEGASREYSLVTLDSMSFLDGKVAITAGSDNTDSIDVSSIDSITMSVPDIKSTNKRSARELIDALNELKVKTSSYKKIGNGNPLMGHKFGADPFGMVDGDRLYVYMTDDHIYRSSDGKPVGDGDYSDCKNISIISSDDLMNWTDHGSQPVAGNNGGSGPAKWANNMWAPCAAHKTIDGKEKYFLLTQTTDLKEPQACFACLPIIGAAVFSKEGGKWVLEAENKYVGMTGGYGVLGGDVGLAEVGPEKHGIVHNLVITKYNCRGGVFDIIMPYHGSIGSFRVGEYEELCIRDNGVAVGRIDALPSGFGFDRSASAGGYYEVTRKLRSQTNARSKVVTTTQRFRFTNGAYKSVKAVSRKKK